MPTRYLIAGCNGAGTTTASYTLLPDLLDCREFVNADEIARGLSPFQPETVAMEAGRIMLHRIQELLTKKVDFAVETTLATRSYVRTVKQAQAAGYTVTLIYFWLSSPEMAVERVKARVRAGGHHIPEDVIRRRYTRGIQNLLQQFIFICDSWTVVDNSHETFVFVAQGQQHTFVIQDQASWQRIQQISYE